MKPTQEEYRLVANTIRGLAMDGVQKANSGHPGMPMGMADVAAVLWLRYLEHCPTNTSWADRDRFVLSGGHGSMLIYSLLHLSGYDLPMEELRNFRQWESMTPGHPEYGDTPGVETTTGPLGQGCGNAVGMALAEKMLAARYNRPGITLVDHYTYVICGDGDMMEGLSHEAFSTAGHLKLNKLIVFYDDNNITIEGETELAYSDDVRRRFQGYNWNVLEIDAHDYNAIEKAIRKAKRSREKPTIVICKSHIGKGSPNKQDKEECHGAPLGEDEVRLTKENLGMPPDETFYVPERVRQLFASRLRSVKRHANKWNRLFKEYEQAEPAKATEWRTAQKGLLPADLESFLPEFEVGTAVATRNASGKVIQGMAKAVPYLVGGSADLAPSNKTLINDVASVGPGAYEGRNLHFGVREHSMGSIMNGMVLHGGLLVFGGTFFVFSDYCRPAIRMAALMGLPVIYVFTHDSFYVGEDGPTHEPVEHLAALRVIPNVTDIRPADPTETGAAWIAALQNKNGPTALMLTRQNLPVIDRQRHPAASNLDRGAYILSQTSADRTPDAILIATGSEVALAMEASKVLGERFNVRVVSMPSWALFEQQSEEYRKKILPPECTARVGIEAGVSFGWERYVGTKGRVIAMDRFGASAPCKLLAEKFGFTPENVIAVVDELMAPPA